MLVGRETHGSPSVPRPTVGAAGACPLWEAPSAPPPTPTGASSGRRPPRVPARSQHTGRRVAHPHGTSTQTRRAMTSEMVRPPPPHLHTSGVRVDQAGRRSVRVSADHRQGRPHTQSCPPSPHPGRALQNHKKRTEYDATECRVDRCPPSAAPRLARPPRASKVSFVNVHQLARRVEPPAGSEPQKQKKRSNEEVRQHVHHTERGCAQKHAGHRGTHGSRKEHNVRALSVRLLVNGTEPATESAVFDRTTTPIRAGASTPLPG